MNTGFYSRLLIFLLFSTVSFATVLRTPALSGDKEAQLALGNLYFYGSKTEVQNYPLAITWYRKALKSGNKVAAFNLAICYDAPFGVERDAIKAMDYYKIAIEAGVAQAYLNLGLLQEQQGDFFEAKRNFKAAADAKIPQAARCYARLTLSPLEKFTYLKQAALLGDVRAMPMLADLYEQKKNRSEMIFWLKKGARSGDAESLSKLGFCYMRGYGIDKNLLEAKSNFSKAARLGNLQAVVEYGKVLKQEGKFTEAFHYFEYAAAQNSSLGHFFMGICHAEGLGTTMNQKKAFLSFEEAAKLGCIQAIYNTGLCFEDGKGVKQSYNMASFWYEKGVDEGDIPSMLALAEFYYYGVGGLTVNQERAKVIVQKAIALGSEDAKLMLNDFNTSLKR